MATDRDRQAGVFSASSPCTDVHGNVFRREQIRKDPDLESGGWRVLCAHCSHFFTLRGAVNALTSFNTAQITVDNSLLLTVKLLSDDHRKDREETEPVRADPVGVGVGEFQQKTFLPICQDRSV